MGKENTINEFVKKFEAGEFNPSDVQTQIKAGWYATVGSDTDCIRTAIIMAMATGSIGATEEEQDGKGNILKTATVRREGHQTEGYYKL